MTNTERIQANNAELREAIELAENLPDAGSGGEVVEPIIEPLAITENGTYSAPDGVDGYSPVTVSVPVPDGYIVPSGTKEITENGTHDAKAYEAVNVNVPIPDGYIKPSGELEVTENGTHDVTEYSSVNVNVPTGGGGDDTSTEDALITRTLTEYTNDRVTTLGAYVFYKDGKLKTVSLPKATSIATYAMYNASVTSVNLPVVKTIGAQAFYACRSLVSIKLPLLTTIGSHCFYDCNALVTADLGLVGNIPANAFAASDTIVTLILRKTSLCTLANTNAFSSTPIASGTGYIYVPSALIDEYKAATNWSTYADQFRAIEDYPDICGGAE